jgi:ElaB/YqjD/DUF883 family membrane-anchored ribosome-binding protein
MAEEQPEVIREQIRETQESLTSKLSTLEDKVVNTVTDTTESVAETVENVKDSVVETFESVKETVQSTVESVKRTFDLPYQTEQHPWLMVAGACAAGFLAGRLLPAAARKAEHLASTLPSEGMRYGRTSAAPEGPRSNGSAGQQPQGPGLLGRLAHDFHDELEQVKGLAIGALFGLARDWVSQHLPPNMAPQVQDMLDNVTTKLGGTRIEGPVLENVTSLWDSRGARSQPQHV